MRVEIGPVPLANAQSWIDYATGIVRELRAEPRTVAPPDVLEAFSSYLDDWQATADAEAARHDAVFRWTGDASPDKVEYLVFALYRLGLRLTNEEDRGLRAPRPPAAAKFHGVLVRSVLAALEREGEGEAHFVAQLREVWQPANERA
jgi:hypothetical protein